MRRRTRALALAGALAAFLIAQACRRHEDPAARASLEEATATAEVRSRLLMADGLAALPLTVEVHEGTATIRGAVADTLQPAAIRAVAERVRGVERVELALRLLPPSDSTAASPAAPAPAAGRASPAAGAGDTTRPAGPAGRAGADSLPSLDEAG